MTLKPAIAASFDWLAHVNLYFKDVVDKNTAYVLHGSFKVLQDVNSSCDALVEMHIKFLLSHSPRMQIMQSMCTKGSECIS